MIRRIVLVLLALGMITPALAGPRKVLVLPLDGTAPIDTRKKLSASFQKMARVLDGEVEAGNTSLAITATAIGCDPASVECIENVRATLGVDELVYGTADETDGTITITARRYRKNQPVRELAMTQATTDPPNKIEPQLLPVFGEEPLPPPDDTPDPTVAAPETTTVVAPDAQPAVEGPQSSNRERNIWIGVTAGGGGLLALGLTLWLSASSLQDDIDGAETESSGDFDRLTELEDKASSRAWAGNIFVTLGLAVAGYGGYRLWKLSKSKAVITPTRTEGGAGVALTFVGDLW